MAAFTLVKFLWISPVHELWNTPPARQVWLSVVQPISQAPGPLPALLWGFMPIPDSSARGGEWQWSPGCGAVKQSSEYCYMYCRISWKSYQPVHSRYKPGSCPVKKQRENSKNPRDNHMCNIKSRTQEMTRYWTDMGTRRDSKREETEVSLPWIWRGWKCSIAVVFQLSDTWKKQHI